LFSDIIASKKLEVDMLDILFCLTGTVAALLACSLVLIIGPLIIYKFIFDVLEWHVFATWFIVLAMLGILVLDCLSGPSLFMRMRQRLNEHHQTMVEKVQQ
jgi:hypothetical protein